MGILPKFLKPINCGLRWETISLGSPRLTASLIIRLKAQINTEFGVLYPSPRSSFDFRPDNLGDVFARLRGWEQGQPGGGGGAVASRVPEEHLRLLPNSSVKQTHVDDQKQCFICMDTYTQGTVRRDIPFIETLIDTVDKR